MVQMKDVVVLIVPSYVLCFDYGFIFAVIVQGKRGIPALDADTFVFLEGQKLIGQIFETFGPVPAPLYSIRFNSVRKQCFVYLHQRKTNGIFFMRRSRVLFRQKAEELCLSKEMYSYGQS